MSGTPTPRDLLAGLRERADEDFLDPARERSPGRHQADIAELGIRVAMTRARYPSRAGGEDLYVVTISRLGLRGRPDVGEGHEVLAALFGPGAPADAVERAAGPLIRMFRMPASRASPLDLEPGHPLRHH